MARGDISDVVLNWYGQSIEKLELYAEAYHAAAKVLTEKSSDNQLRDIGSGPVVFLYRLSLELWLKAVLISGSRIVEQQGGDFETTELILNKGHNLTELLKAFKVLCQQLDWEWNAEHEELAAIVRQFNKIDLFSFCFRYPVNKRGEPGLEPNFSFDLRNFCARMDEILVFLDQTDCGLAGTLDLMQEAGHNG